MSMSNDQKEIAFRFYEEAAEKTKAHAWSQTTWILALNAGIFAFSLSFYAEHAHAYGFILIEIICALVGIVLCFFLVYLLQELGGHIRHYWTVSNKLAVEHAPLRPFISGDDAAAAESPCYRAPFPPFCRRLQWLAGLFVLSHVGWALVAICLRFGPSIVSQEKATSQGSTTNVFIYITQPNKTN